MNLHRIEAKVKHVPLRGGFFFATSDDGRDFFVSMSALARGLGRQVEKEDAPVVGSRLELEVYLDELASMSADRLPVARVARPLTYP